MHGIIVPGCLPKYSSDIEEGIAQKLLTQKHRLGSFLIRSRHSIYFSRKVGYFLQVVDFVPQVIDGSGNSRYPSEFKTLSFSDSPQANIALCALNSNLFYWFITVCSDCRHVNKREVEQFPIDISQISVSPIADKFATLGCELMDSMQINSEMREMRFEHDHLTVQCIIPRMSKPIIDKIDHVLAQHYSFTDGELDFIINYDIKYRMGRETEGDYE